MKNWRKRPMLKETKDKIRKTCQRLYKEGKLLKDRKMTQEIKDKISKTLINRELSVKHKNELSKRMIKLYKEGKLKLITSLQTHHIDLNQKNNNEENLIRKFNKKID